MYVAPLTDWMLALWAERTSGFSWEIAFWAIESPPCGRLPSALVIFPLLTVICTCTSPYWVFSAGPVKVPDGAVFVGVGFGVVGCGVGVTTGAAEWVAGGVVLVGEGLGVAFFVGDAGAGSPTWAA